MQSIPPYTAIPRAKRSSTPPNDNQLAFGYAKQNIESLIYNLPSLTPVGIKSVSICLKRIQKNSQKIYTQSFLDRVNIALAKLDYKNPKFRSPEYNEKIKLTIEEIKSAWQELCEDTDAYNNYKNPF